MADNNISLEKLQEVMERLAESSTRAGQRFDFLTKSASEFEAEINVLKEGINRSSGNIEYHNKQLDSINKTYNKLKSSTFDFTSAISDMDISISHMSETMDKYNKTFRLGDGIFSKFTEKVVGSFQETELALKSFTDSYSRFVEGMSGKGIIDNQFVAGYKNFAMTLDSVSRSSSLSGRSAEDLSRSIDKLGKVSNLSKKDLADIYSTVETGMLGMRNYAAIDGLIERISKLGNTAQQTKEILQSVLSVQQKFGTTDIIGGQLTFKETMGLSQQDFTNVLTSQMKKPEDLDNKYRDFLGIAQRIESYVEDKKLGIGENVGAGVSSAGNFLGPITAAMGAVASTVTIFKTLNDFKKSYRAQRNLRETAKYVKENPTEGSPGEAGGKTGRRTESIREKSFDELLNPGSLGVGGGFSGNAQNVVLNATNVTLNTSSLPAPGGLSSLTGYPASTPPPAPTAGTPPSVPPASSAGSTTISSTLDDLIDTDSERPSPTGIKETFSQKMKRVFKGTTKGTIGKNIWGGIKGLKIPGLAMAAPLVLDAASNWAANTDVGFMKNIRESDTFKKSAPALSYASSALSGASTGAAIGSLIPGIGTLVGGIVGGAVGLGSKYFGGEKKDNINQEEKYKKIQELTGNIARNEGNREENLKQLSSLTKEYNNLIGDSGEKLDANAMVLKSIYDETNKALRIQERMNAVLQERETISKSLMEFSKTQTFNISDATAYQNLIIETSEKKLKMDEVMYSKNQQWESTRKEEYLRSQKEMDSLLEKQIKIKEKDGINADLNDSDKKRLEELKQIIELQKASAAISGISDPSTFSLKTVGEQLKQQYQQTEQEKTRSINARIETQRNEADIMLQQAEAMENLSTASRVGGAVEMTALLNTFSKMGVQLRISRDLIIDLKNRHKQLNDEILRLPVNSLERQGKVNELQRIETDIKRENTNQMLQQTKMLEKMNLLRDKYVNALPEAGFGTGFEFDITNDKGMSLFTEGSPLIGGRHGGGLTTPWGGVGAMGGISTGRGVQMGAYGNFAGAADTRAAAYATSPSLQNAANVFLPIAAGRGYASGGKTSINDAHLADGGIVSVLHPNEVVLNEKQISRLGLTTKDFANAGVPGFAVGGGFGENPSPYAQTRYPNIDNVRRIRENKQWKNLTDSVYSNPMEANKASEKVKELLSSKSIESIDDLDFEKLLMKQKNEAEGYRRTREILEKVRKSSEAGKKTNIFSKYIKNQIELFKKMGKFGKAARVGGGILGVAGAGYEGLDAIHSFREGKNFEGWESLRGMTEGLSYTIGGPFYGGIATATNLALDIGIDSLAHKNDKMYFTEEEKYKLAVQKNMEARQTAQNELIAKRQGNKIKEKGLGLLDVQKNKVTNNQGKDIMKGMDKTINTNVSLFGFDLGHTGYSSGAVMPVYPEYKDEQLNKLKNQYSIKLNQLKAVETLSNLKNEEDKKNIHVVSDGKPKTEELSNKFESNKIMKSIQYTSDQMSNKRLEEISQSIEASLYNQLYKLINKQNNPNDKKLLKQIYPNVPEDILYGGDFIKVYNANDKKYDIVQKQNNLGQENKNNIIEKVSENPKKYNEEYRSDRYYELRRNLFNDKRPYMINYSKSELKKLYPNVPDDILYGKNKNYSDVIGAEKDVFLLNKQREDIKTNPPNSRSSIKTVSNKKEKSTVEESEIRKFEISSATADFVKNHKENKDKKKPSEVQIVDIDHLLDIYNNGDINASRALNNLYRNPKYKDSIRGALDTIFSEKLGDDNFTELQRKQLKSLGDIGGYVLHHFGDRTFYNNFDEYGKQTGKKWEGSKQPQKTTFKTYDYNNPNEESEYVKKRNAYNAQQKESRRVSGVGEFTDLQNPQQVREFMYYKNIEPEPNKSIYSDQQSGLYGNSLDNMNVDTNGKVRLNKRNKGGKITDSESNLMDGGIISILHPNEVVLNKGQVDKLGLKAKDFMDAGVPGFASGGHTFSNTTSGHSGGGISGAIGSKLLCAHCQASLIEKTVVNGVSSMLGGGSSPSSEFMTKSGNII